MYKKTINGVEYKLLHNVDWYQLRPKAGCELDSQWLISSF
jgi:hypothetical protein